MEVGSVAESHHIPDEVYGCVPFVQEHLLGIVYSQVRPPASEVLSDLFGEIQMQHFPCRPEFMGDFFTALVVFPVFLLAHPFLECLFDGFKFLVDIIGVSAGCNGCRLCSLPFGLPPFPDRYNHSTVCDR